MGKECLLGLTVTLGMEFWGVGRYCLLSGEATWGVLLYGFLESGEEAKTDVVVIIVVEWRVDVIRTKR